MSLSTPSYKLNKFALFSAMTAALVITSGCQSLKTANATNQSMTTVQNQPQKLESFNITGKIGVTTPANDTTGAQGGSAFYAWGQQDDRFAIELIGALGIGKTNIEYNGQTATLVSEKTGTLTADDPEELLKKPLAGKHLSRKCLIGYQVILHLQTAHQRWMTKTA